MDGYYLSVQFLWWFLLQLLCVAQLGADSRCLTPQMFTKAQALLTQDAKTNMLRDLSALQLCLVCTLYALFTLTWQINHPPIKSWLCIYHWPVYKLFTSCVKFGLHIMDGCWEVLALIG